jgi:succinoglycan biosynthesis transport protein ExoP
MLSPSKPPGLDENWNQTSFPEYVDFDRILVVIRRQWKTVAVTVAFFLALGVLYWLIAVPQYTATASVLIDSSANDVANQLSTMSVSGVIDDEPTVLSQVELLKSYAISSATVDRLHLVDNPYFRGTSRSILASLANFLHMQSLLASDDAVGLSAEDIRASAIAVVANGVSVDRAGRTYVLQISYTSPIPDLSALIANGIADAYLDDKLNSKYEATKRASGWLQDRIEDLKQRSLDSDLAVQKFKALNGLISSNQGGLVSDQRLVQLNTAMIEAQAETAKAQARYDQVQSIISSHNPDAIVTDALGSTTITDLRKKYLDASKLQSEIADRLGPQHEQAIRLRAEMAEYERLMFGELGRIAESYKSELYIAKAKEKSLSDSVAASTGVAAAAGETQVQLRELERTADTYTNLYQTFLTRLQEATQQQSFPVSNARIITPAEVPLHHSQPKTTIILAVSLVLGGMFGSGFASVREFRDRFFRTGDQVRDELKLEYLGIAPVVTQSAKPVQVSRHHRALQSRTDLSSYVVEHPYSSFAETMRSAKLAADVARDERGKCVIGITSSLPGEGKSTIACNFAQLLAMQGAKTLLIDGDFRNPGATREFAGSAGSGILEALLEKRPLSQLILFDPSTKLAFLPAVAKHRIPHSAELLSSGAMRDLLFSAQQAFDYVVIDLPPLGPVVDARAISPLLDTMLYVIEWGRTSRKMVRNTLLGDPELADKCAGVILNKVQPEKMKLYRTYGSSEYYQSHYASYYHDEK